MFPAQYGTVPHHGLPKPVFYNSWYEKPPLGCMPFMCDGGGRYDGDPITPGWQEDSFWVGGYYGPAMDIITEKVVAAMAPLPPGYHYCFNVEHWGNKTDDEIEDTIRRFRKFFLTAKRARPDCRFGVYDIAPSRDYWRVTNYHLGLKAWEKYKKSGWDSLDGSDRWALGGVAEIDWYKQSYTWDETKEFVAAFRAWQKSNDRYTYGKYDNGVTKAAWGVVDVIDYLAVSLYDFYQGDDTEAYVKHNVAECRRIGEGRPVYPFVWPKYHDGSNGNPMRGQTIPVDEWRLHVRRVLKYADGCMIWGAEEKEHAEHIRIALDEAERAVSGRAA